MTIKVKMDNSVYILVGNNFRCAHENVDLSDGVYCYDCRNEDLTFEEVCEFQYRAADRGDYYEF